MTFRVPRRRLERLRCLWTLTGGLRMAKVTISKKFPGGDLGEWVRGKIDRIESGNRELLELSVQAGSELTKGHIASRPTAWLAAIKGKTGRIETQRMLDAVGFRSASVAQYDWRGACGWGCGRRAHFLLQEGGGKNTITARRSEGDTSA